LEMAHPTGFEPVTSAFGGKWLHQNINNISNLGTL